MTGFFIPVDRCLSILKANSPDFKDNGVLRVHEK